jgi:hypothetical protein
MTAIKKFYRKLGDILPMIWGMLWFTIITITSVATLIWVTKWLLRLLGVM